MPFQRVCSSSNSQQEAGSRVLPGQCSVRSVVAAGQRSAVLWDGIKGANKESSDQLRVTMVKREMVRLGCRAHYCWFLLTLLPNSKAEAGCWAWELEISVCNMMIKALVHCSCFLFGSALFWIISSQAALKARW